MDIKAKLGRQVAIARKQRSLRLQDVAKRTGRNLARVSELENGKSNNTVDFLIEIGAALGLTLMFVPNDKLENVEKIILRDHHQTVPAHTLPTVFDELFIDDGDSDPGETIADRK